MEPGFYCMDCMEGMARAPDKFWDLCIVDPPYGGVTCGSNMKNKASNKAASRQYNTTLWKQSPPGKVYFDELFRVSKNQIIWGGNYFQKDIAKNSQCWIVWDKENGCVDFADCELAWTSFNTAVRKFSYKWAGMLQGNMKDKEPRIHPTQKPIPLYKWLLTKYAKPGDKILDTHVGSASSLIACHQMGFQYWGFELDPDYYKAASDRLDKTKAQASIFDAQPKVNQEQLSVS
jgi:site-specific DNA-methyltransferase (adenine-specific)